MKIAKKKKKNPIHKETKTPFAYVKLTNYLNLAVMVRTLYMVYGWRSVRLARFLESYVALMQEITDHRSSVNEFIKDTEELTGIDVTEFFEEVLNDEGTR